jgi:S1-C subfamily serine protease
MKRRCFIWLFLVLLLESAVAQQSTNLIQTNALSHSSRPQQISGGKLITREGAAYKGVVVQKALPDGLVIGYTMPDGGIGIAKIKFKDLSDNLQQQFGYNSTNAAAFENDQTKAQEQWRAKWAADDEKALSKRREQEIADAETRARWVGTGFFITDNGYLLTCFHVVTNATSIQVGTKRGLFNAQLVQSDPDKDVALLKVTGTFSSLPLISTNGVNLGEAVFTIGFPNLDAQGWQPKLTRGEISSLSGFQDDANQYQISVPTQPGNSGGALIDEHGNVVGLVAATLTASDEYIKDRIALQNVNYAIKSDCAKTLLDALPGGWPVKLKTAYPPEDRKFEEVVKTAQDAVVIVLVQ